MCADRLSTTELLQSIKRLCTERICFFKAKPDSNLSAMYTGTIRMLDEELEHPSAPENEKVFTILSNLLLILNNSAAHLNKGKQNGSKELITFDLTDSDHVTACAYLDQVTNVTARYESVEKQRKIAQSKAAMRHKITLCVRITLASLLFICTVLFLSRYFMPISSARPESGDIFSQIANWFRYDLFHESLPLSESEQWFATSLLFGYAGAIIGFFWLITTVVSRILHTLFRKKNAGILREWTDYQRICDAFGDTSEQLNELEW